jgi:hypothetical protein
MREHHPELDLRRDPSRRGQPVAAVAQARTANRDFGGLLAAFAYGLVARPPAAETPVAKPPQRVAGDIKGSEAPLR